MTTEAQAGKEKADELYSIEIKSLCDREHRQENETRTIIKTENTRVVAKREGV